VEYGAFRRHALREVVWAHPGGFDQVVYLSDSYETYEEMKERGVLAGLRHGLRLPVQTSMLIHLQASLLFLLLGASRLSALTLNFGYFALLQVVLASTLRWLSRRWSVAFLGVGLLLTAGVPFLPWGGIMDFRLDFSAGCLFGVVLCLVVRSGVFASRKWSLLAGAAAGFCVLFRFLTLTYLTGIFGALFFFYAVRWRRAPDGQRPPAAHRLGNMLLTALLIVGIVGPVLWYKREGFLAHYVAHVRGGENQIMGLFFGASTLWQRAVFYVTSVARDHAGAAFGLAAALVLLGALVLAACRLVRRVRCQSDWPVDRRATGVAIALSVLVPLAALIVYPSPSPLVAGVTIPGVVLSVVFAAVLLAGVPGGQGGRVASTVLTVLAAALVVGGLGLYSRQLRHRSWPSRHPDNEAELLGVYDLIARKCLQAGVTAPRIFVDNISDTLFQGTMRPAIYERHGALLMPLSSCGAGLFAVTEQEALAGLHQSDFVILTTRTLFPENQLFPFDRSMQQLRPRLTQVCGACFVPLGQFYIYGRYVVIYMRPALAARCDPDRPAG
jgi:hypothetical protein